MATRFFMGAFETGMFPGCEWHLLFKLVVRTISLLMEFPNRFLPHGHVV